MTLKSGWKGVFAPGNSSSEGKRELPHTHVLYRTTKPTWLVGLFHALLPDSVWASEALCGSHLFCFPGGFVPSFLATEVFSTYWRVITTQVTTSTSGSGAPMPTPSRCRVCAGSSSEHHAQARWGAFVNDGVTGWRCGCSWLPACVLRTLHPCQPAHAPASHEAQRNKIKNRRLGICCAFQFYLPS